MLVLLDLSAAFDTIDHAVLLQRLQLRYGITGIALKWFSSYLKDRSQTVSIDDCESKPHKIIWGVPQGSVCGAPLFTLYTAPISDIISRHELQHIEYTDDTQVYAIFRPSERDSVIRRLEACICDIKAWAVKNGLQLNDDKTEILHFSSRFVDCEPLPPVKIGSSCIIPSSEARNLGVTFDSHLRLKTHVSNICRSGWAFIYMLGRIRKYLDNDSTERLVHAFITSRLDCCNSLLTGLPDNELQKLQRLQNASARLVTRSRRRDHITPVLQSLHWLPVSTGSGTNFCSWSSKLSMNMFPLILIVSYAPIRPAAISGLPHKSLSGFHHSVHVQVSMAKGHSPLLGRHYGTLFLLKSGTRSM